MILRWQLPPYRPGNRIIVGTTRCGKSTAVTIDILAAAALGMAIVVIDPHMNSLAWNGFVQLVAAGQSRRLLFDRLSDLSHFLGYRFLCQSTAREEIRREAENEQSMREFIDVLLRRRDIQSLASHPLTEDFLLDALMLVLYQRVMQPASDIQFAFQPGHKRFNELLKYCTREEIVAKFRAIADGSVKPGQYASAARLIRSVCASPAFVHRCRSEFDLPKFLGGGGILLVEGASHGVSADTANTILGSVVLQTIQYVRSRHTTKPRVLLVLDEATNASLIGSAGHEVRAMAELQKKGLDVFVLVQSPNFPSSFIEDAVFTNAIEHQWFFCANQSVAEQAARDLGDPDYRTAIRRLRTGERYIRRLDQVWFDAVTPLPDPWTIPGLAQAKARKALDLIQQRPEFWSPSACPSNLIILDESPLPPSTRSSPDSKSTNESSKSQTGTSASADISGASSPAVRLRTARSNASEKKGGSAPPEPSS